MIRSILLLLLIWFSFGSLAQKSKGDEYNDQASAFIDKGDVKKALKALNTAAMEYAKEQNWYRYWSSMQSISNYYQEVNQWDESLAILQKAEATVRGAVSSFHVLGGIYDNLGYYYLNQNLLNEAINAYTKAIDAYNNAGPDYASMVAFEQVNRAIAYDNLSDFGSAISDMNAAIEFYEKELDIEPAELAISYQALGTYYRKNAEYQEAINSFEMAQKLIARSDERELKASLLNDIGVSYFSFSKLDLAIQNLKGALEMNQALFGKDADHYAQTLVNLGNTYAELGDLNSAMTAFEEVRTIYQAIPPSNLSDLVDLLLNVSRVSIDLGLVEQSKALAEEALKVTISEFGENNLLEADIYMQMASSALQNAELDVSLTYNFKALSILELNKYPFLDSYAIIYNNIGQAYDELYDFDLGLQYKNKALGLYEQFYGSRHKTFATALASVGISYEGKGDYEKALEYLHAALKLRVELLPAGHDEIGRSYLNIGLVHIKKLDFVTARENLEKALSIYDHHQKNIAKAMVLNRLAFCMLSLNDPTAAAQYYHKAIVSNVLNFDNPDPEVNPSDADFLDYYEMIISLIGKTDIAIRKGDAASLEGAVLALDDIDNILKEKSLTLISSKDRLRLAQVNYFFTEAGLLATHQLFSVSNNPEHLAKAFYYSERSKANELFADIQASKASQLSRLPRKLAEKQSQLSIKINTMEHQIASAHMAKNLPVVEKLKAEQLTLVSEYQSLQTQINQTAPKYAAITGQRSLPTWNEVKTHLDAKTALVSYVITDSAKYVLVGNQTKLILKQLPTAADLDRLVRAYRNQIKYRSSAFKIIGDELTDLIWAPVEEAFKELGGIENVIIIPDGPLSYLPFEALGRGRFLLEKYNIRYQLSGAMMLTAGENRVRNKPSMIAMAPVFEDEETNFVNKSCLRFVEATQKADTSTRAFSLNGEYITPLPATETEVQKIHEIHTDKDIFSKYFLKEAAREELIKKGELEQFDYIHLATHGIVNSQYPELSGLLLTQDPESPEDGILYTGEIFGLNLNADLVTLSACETALGKKVEGEGVRGLTTAFLYAGAKSVVVSLWKVADESTAQLMIEFYTQLLAGNDKVTSLKAAKLKLLAGGTFQHPYYWAPFVQIGGN